MFRRPNDFGLAAVQHWFFVTVIVCSVALGWAAVRARDVEPPEHRVTERPTQVREDGYTSSQACAGCHPSQHATWFGSFHRTMTQVATPETVRAGFDGTYVPAEHGGPMMLERRGNEFWAEFDDPDWTSESGGPRRIERRIVMITGSHHQQVYWYATGRERLIGQLPGMYLIAEQRWIPRGAAFVRPPGEAARSEVGRWNTTCINCHATHGKGMLATLPQGLPHEWPNAETTVADFGIACEACHGPAEEHVRINGDPIRRYRLHLTGARDPSVVNPARLDAKKSSQVCGQCHGIFWSFFADAGTRDAVLEGGTPYKPGGDLAATRFIVQPMRNHDTPQTRRILELEPLFLEDHFWPDGQVRVSGREYNGLIDSPCYLNATDDARTITCLSCHTMHKTPEDQRSIFEWADTHQVAPGMNSNEACLQCHSTFKTTLVEHTRHKPDSAGSSCYNCHMPYTSYGLLKALRSHRISSPTVTESLDSGRPNACNLCHLDRTLAWTADYLERWYDTPKPALNADEQGVAASLLWLLRGDAGQRALVAWSMGWQPAQEASGRTWLPPYLGLLLDDPYDAVRYIANRSLKSLPGFAGFGGDFMAPRAQRMADVTRAVAVWRSAGGTNRTDAALLLDADGNLTADGWRRLFEQRNDRRVRLNE